MVIVVRIAFFRSFSLICTVVTAAICTWSSVHGHYCTHIYTRKKNEKERKRKEKNERKRFSERAIVARRQWFKAERKKKE